MTQTEKDLLLKDLCARLPYGVKVEITHWKNRDKDIIDHKILGVLLDINKTNILTNTAIDVKPYLLPLSSMTEEQRCEYHNHCDVGLTEWGNELYYDCAESFDWLNAHHFDYRGLIEKGLAIDCTNLNIY